jgi:flavin-dependent dehydrogenase
MRSNGQICECDALIIGGGPAGSTAAALLAAKGHRVTLLEKARHPRFHIGESLLPANLPLLERLGVADEVRAIGMRKYGAEFVSPWHMKSQVFQFADAWDKSMPYAYQVRRSEFDEILIRNAERKGATVLEGCRVKAVDFAADGKGATVQAQHDDGTMSSWRAKFVIDASGRDTFLGNRFQAKQRNPKHNSSALYGHFAGAQRLPGDAAGNITIFWFEHGWFWFIPLADGVTSIGATTWPYYMKTRGERSLDQFLLDTLKMSPALMQRLEQATLVSAVEATGNFSYVCDRTCGPGYLLLGDAYAFIDPVFSSGVMLAMNSAFVGAETVDACLRDPSQQKAAFARFDRAMKHGPKEFSWFIYRITTPTMRDLFMDPSNGARMKEALLSVLAGDIFGKTPIWRSVFAFKLVYYIAAALKLKRSLAAWARRKKNILPVDDVQTDSAK